MEFLWVKTSLLDFSFTLGVVVIIPGNMLSTRPSLKKLTWVQTIPMTCPVGSSMPEAARPAHSDPSWFGRGGDRSKVERKMYWIVLIQFVCCSVMWCHVVCIETPYFLNTYLRSYAITHLVHQSFIATKKVKETISLLPQRMWNSLKKESQEWISNIFKGNSWNVY